MTDKEKLEKLKKLADAMYYAAQHLTTDASRLHKAMNEYHQFIIHECKEEPVNNDFEMALAEMIYKAQTSVVEPLVIAAQWKDELIKLAKSEESVSEDLEKCTSKIILEGTNFNKSWYAHPELAFKAGAKWKKENLWKSADGDDLPEYDREVIAILDYDFGHYKVVYAHRPNPNGWNGTNIDTEEKEHFEPEIYDKGGWNQPHVLYWLDAKLPYEENKITK